ALPLFSGWERTALILALPLLTLLLLWWLPGGIVLDFSFLDYALEPVRVTAIGRLFAAVFAISAFAGGLFALHQSRLVELVAAYIYAGGAIGVTLAGDLLTLFVFWELMALGSTLVIWAANTEAAYAASLRYLLIHLLGGVILMSGITAHVLDTGSVTFQAMQPDSLGNWLILIGFLINAGAPPLSAWIADAYPEASPSGMLFLSVFTTKSALYALLVGFPGLSLLIPVGLYMAFYGIIYALLENDMRRLLAYGIVNQMGFLVAAIGIGTPIALNAAASPASTLAMALLLMTAGSVLAATGKRKFTELGGLFKNMPITTLYAIIGALSLSAFPFTIGYLSKSLITQAVADAHLLWPWLSLLAASAGVVLYGALKFPWSVFFQAGTGLQPADPPWNRQAAMGLLAVLCILPGCYPPLLYDLLPWPVDYQPYTASHLLSTLQLLLFAGLAFIVMLPQLKRSQTITLDFDWFYRRFGKILAREFVFGSSKARENMEQVLHWQVRVFIRWLFIHHGPKGRLARTWPTGSMVFWVAVLLGACLIFYYV
ncbi:MAG TPA: Na(+)/H(+) antiporter subunit D, partial [Candidatus Competibacteraceae bacterium]|nr:Na(+)/H(+) antiporter subunit D [Candidatus Competibacteraceae bacterium]